MKRTTDDVARRDAGADAAPTARCVKIIVWDPVPVDWSAVGVVTEERVRWRRGLLLFLGRVNHVTASAFALVRLWFGQLDNWGRDRCCDVSGAGSVLVDCVDGALDPGKIEHGGAVQGSAYEATEDGARVPDDRATTSEEMIDVVGAFTAEGAAGVRLETSLQSVGEVDGLSSSLGGPGVDG